MSYVKGAASILFLIWCGLIFIGLMLLVFPFILASSLIKDQTKAENYIFFFLRLWGQAFSILCLYPVKVEGTPDPSKAYIYICNHNSYLDAIAVVLAIPDSFKPLGKIEMQQVPVFGLIYKRIVVLIDRKDKVSRARSIIQLKEDLARGQSVLIFPEGTMNRGEHPLADFYDGAFRLSVETGTPIMPLVMLNARKLLPRNRPMEARPGLITCLFGNPIDPRIYNDPESIKMAARAQMSSLLGL